MRVLHARAGRIPAPGQLLTFEEIESFVRIAVTMGIDKVRLTGGEPLVRRDVPVLIEKLVAIPGIKDIGLTTNGILLAPVARSFGKRAWSGSTSAWTRWTPPSSSG